MATGYLHRTDNTPTLPHEVAARHLVGEVSLLRAWREYLNLTQGDLAARLAVSRSRIAQWERPAARPRHATFGKLAAAMGLHIVQLTLKENT